MLTTDLLVLDRVGKSHRSTDEMKKKNYRKRKREREMGPEGEMRCKISMLEYAQQHT